MERSWKTTHQARRRISTMTSNTGGIGSSATSGVTSRPISEGTIKPTGTAGPYHNNKATNVAGSNRVLTGTSVSTSSSLFCNANGVERNTSFLKDEEGLTDIIENAFEHHYHQKQHQPHLKTPPPTSSTALSSVTATAAAATTPTTTTTTAGSRLYSRAGRTPSNGSITGLMSIDDDDDTTTVSATNEYFQLERNPRRLPTTTTHPKHTTSGKRRRPLSSLLSILDANINRSSSSSSSSSKVSRFTFLLFIWAIIYLSIRNASQGMQNLGLTVPKTTTILLGGNRAGMIRHQKRQYAEQLLERKREVESQTKDIFTTIRNAPNVGVPIPSAYKHLVEVEPPTTSSTNMLANTTATTTTTTTTNPIPFFWHLPRSGGSTIRDLVTYCYGFTMATGQGKVPNDLSITVSFFYTAILYSSIFFFNSIHFMLDYKNVKRTIISHHSFSIYINT
jgi:hypothetical protein